MFVFCNPCARAELHQQKRARKLCSATLTPFWVESLSRRTFVYFAKGRSFPFNKCRRWFSILFSPVVLPQSFSQGLKLGDLSINRLGKQWCTCFVGCKEKVFLNFISADLFPKVNWICCRQLKFCRDLWSNRTNFVSPKYLSSCPKLGMIIIFCCT